MTEYIIAVKEWCTKKHNAVFIAFATLSILDAHSTVLALQNPAAMESNPIVRYAINNFGLLGALTGIKAISIGVVYALKEIDYFTPTMVVICLIYVVVVTMNYVIAFA